MTRVLATGFAAVFVARGLASQTPIVVADPPACRSCAVVVGPSVQIGSTDGEGALTVSEPLVSRDRLGRLYVHGGSVESAAVYDSSGRFIRRLGRTGSGPGEYRVVSGVVGIRGDSVALIDGTLMRMTILAPDLSVARMVNLSGQFAGPSSALGRPAEVWVTAPDARRGPAVTAIDIASGRVLSAFANAADDGLSRVQEGTARTIAADASGAWMAFLSQYRLEHWLATGTRDIVMTRDVPWFQPMTLAESRDRLARGEPSPFVQSMAVDGAGRVWVLISVPDARWQQAIRRSPEQRFPQVVDPVRYKDSLLEVFDSTGKLLLSTRYDVPKLALLSGPRLVESGEDADGRPVLRISPLRFRVP